MLALKASQPEHETRVLVTLRIDLVSPASFKINKKPPHPSPSFTGGSGWNLSMGPHHCIGAHVFGSLVGLNRNDLRRILASTVSLALGLRKQLPPMS